MKVYLIAGRARSGKTQTAKILKELLEKENRKVVITEYSKYIKLFAKDFLGWDMISEPKPRAFLQEMGEYVRHLNKDTYFTERMKEDLNIYSHFVDDVIISDVRMPKELEELKSFHPVKIKVVNENANYDLTPKEASHETEHALDNYEGFDYVIKNKTEQEIKEVLKKIIRKVIE